MKNIITLIFNDISRTAVVNEVIEGKYMKKQFWVKLLAVAMTGALLIGCNSHFALRNDDSEESLEMASEESLEMASEETDDDNSEKQYGITLVSKEHVDSSGLTAEEQLTEDFCISDDTGDVTGKVDGIKGSSLDGHMKVSRNYNDDKKPVYLFELDGEKVGSLVMESYDYPTFNYIQLKDIDGDGMEEILVATYTYSTGPVIAVDFSVLKYASGQNAADGSSYGVNINYHPSDDHPNGNAYFFIEADDELAGGSVTYVSLEDNGVQVVVDKGEKIDAVYYPDEYVLTIN